MATTNTRKSAPKTQRAKAKAKAVAGLKRTDPKAKTPQETDLDIANRINERFELAHDVVKDVIWNKEGMRSCIISGPAGVGKSYQTEEELQKYDPQGEGWNYSVFKGYMKATGIFRELFGRRHEGQVIVFDDCDSILRDETCLNLLKAATDTIPQRRLTWGSDYDFGLFEDEPVERQFDYNGKIIFITNLDFDELIAKNGKNAEHLKALMSRSIYVNLGIKRKRDFFVRVKTMVDRGMLSEHGLDAEQQKMVVDYMEENVELLREVNLRMAVKLSNLIKANANTPTPMKWRQLADMSQLIGQH